MGTHSSAINSLASSATHDLYASWTGRRDPVHLLRVGRLISAGWALGLIGGALFFQRRPAAANAGRGARALDRLGDLGPLLGTYFLAGRWPRARGHDVVGAVAVTVRSCWWSSSPSARGESGLGWLEPLGRLAWPWYVRSAPCSLSAAAWPSAMFGAGQRHPPVERANGDADPDRGGRRRKQDRGGRVGR